MKLLVRLLITIPALLGVSLAAERPSAAAFADPSPATGSGHMHQAPGGFAKGKLTAGAKLVASALRDGSGSAPVAPANLAGGGAYSDDILHIASACENDPGKLFDFVRNHIRYTPYFGFRKGADLTWLSKSGNDADQAELLVKLLQAAGFSAQYEYGQLSIPLSQARAWLGVDNDTALDQLLGSSGYPGVVDSGGGVLIIESIWVSATISGTTYRMHPAHKTFTTLPGIDLGAALGYSHTALMTAAGGTQTANFVQGVSDAGVSDYLKARATAFVNTIRTSLPNAAVDEIVGGRRINETEIATLGGAFPPFFTVNSSVLFTDPNAIADALTVVVGVSNGSGGISEVRAGFTYTRRSIGAARISVTFAADGHAQIWIDDDLVDEEGTPFPGGAVVLGLAIDHQYFGDYYDQSRIVPVTRTGSYAVLASTGGYDAPELARRRQLQVDAYQRQGLAVNSRQIRTEALHLLGLDWARQWELTVDLLSRQAQFLPIFHHTLAVFSQNESFQVDIPATLVTLSRDGDIAKTYGNLRSTLLLGSAMEHGVIRQDYPGKDAVSTVRYTRRNNALGKKTFLATGTNYGSIAGDASFIAGWSAFYRNSVFPSLIFSQGWQLVIPEDGAQVVDQLTGNGYFEFTEGEIGAIISSPSYSLKGGHATTTGEVDPDKSGYQIDPTEGPETQDNPESKEPVDLFTGAFVSDHADLTLGGDRARGLLLARSYSSAAKDVPSDLGYGWNHSCRSFLHIRTDTGLALGGGTPAQTAAAIATLYILNDVLRNDSGSAKGWVVASITADWLMDQVSQNAVDVTVGRKNYTFTRHPDFASFVPAAGVTAQFVRDGTTGLFRIEERFGNTTFFDAQNRVSSFVDADGKTLGYAYDGAGRVQTVTDCYGRTLSFTYYAAGASAGRLQSVSDSTGRVVSYAYVGGYLDSVTDPENHVTHFEYDADGRLSATRNELNQPVVENTYDALGRMCQQVAEGDAAQTWQFAITGARNVQIDPLGHRTTMIFDEKGRETASIDALGHRTTMIYDGQDHLISLTDPNSHTTNYQYDGRSNLRFVTNANGHTTEMVYDAQDRLDYVLDEAGKKTDFAFDTEHHLTGVIDPMLRTTTYQYHPGGVADGLLWKIIENNGDTTTFVYDANGNPDTITRPDGSVVDLAYNARGDMTHSTISTPGDPNIHEVTLTYDKRRLLLTTRDAQFFGVTNTYDPRRRLVARTDRFGKTTSQTFSPWGRANTLTEPNGATTVFHNDIAGRRNRITNALNQITQQGFDLADRMATVTDALNQPMNLGYDAAGNRTSLTNPRGKTWSWTHTAVNLGDTMTSPLGRVWDSNYNTRELLETLTEPSLQATAFLYFDDRRLKQTTDPIGVVSYAYDTKGRLDKVTEGAAVIDRDWDALDRLARFTDSAGNVVEYTYDGAGNLRTLKYPGGKTVTYTYDTADQLDFVTDWAGRITDFQYDSNSRLSTVVFPNGTKRRLTYDSAGRVASIRDETGALQVISQFQFSYDPLNRIEREIGTPEAASFSVLPATMTYDNDDRLLTWNGQACASDSDGNLTTGPLGGSPATFGYDTRNRLTSAGGTTYAYDAENRRVSQTTAGVTTSYVHDPQGALSRLLSRTVGGITTRYVYAGGMLLYEETGAATKTYHFDARGSTVALTDDAQTVTDRINYGPYGETAARTGATPTPFLYHGAYGVQTDANGLCHMRARFYSVEARRFLNADPIGFGGGMNWYGFVGGDPSNLIDPLGLEWWKPGTTDYILDADHAVQAYMGISSTDSAALDRINAEATFRDSPLRGFYVAGGLAGKMGTGTYKPGWAGGVEANWTMDEGFGGSAQFGVGFQMRGRGRGGKFESQQFGAYAGVNWSEDCSFSGSGGIYMGSGNKNGNRGGQYEWTTPDMSPNTVKFGLGPKFLNIGVIVDVDRLTKFFR